MGTFRILVTETGGDVKILGPLTWTISAAWCGRLLPSKSIRCHQQSNLALQLVIVLL